MKAFCNFAEVDSYFCKLFTDKQSIFAHLKYGNIPVGIALQHNIYDYYKTFIHTPKIKTPIVERFLSLARIYGLDHRFKWVINNFLGTKMISLIKGKTIFFADNYVPRILEDFLKIIAEMDASSAAFVTTDYRAYKYMRGKAKTCGLQILLLAPVFSKKAGPLNRKQVLNDRLVSGLQKEFNGFARKIFKIIRFNLGILVNYYNLFEEYLEQARPAKIVLGSDGFSVARILCFVAKDKKISTYVLQHGMIDSLNGYLPLVADYIFLWTHFEKMFFQKNGVVSRRLLVAGSPRFQHPSTSCLKHEESLENNQLLFVIAPATPQDVYSQIDLIVEISRNLVIPYMLLIRPHPYYKRVAKSYFGTLNVNETIILDEQPFLQSIRFSRCVIFADVSTGVFEALTMNKSIFIIANQSSSKFDIYNFPKIKIADLTQGLNSNLSSIATFDLGDFSKEEMPSMSNKASVFIASYLNRSH